MKKLLIFLTLISLSFVSCNMPKYSMEKTVQATLVATQTGEPVGNLDATARAARLTTQAIQPTRATASTPAFTPSPLANQTTHGHILQDEVWRGEIHIIGDIFVEEGVTLTIEPGTVVRMASNQDVENLFDWPFDMKIGIQNEVNNINGVHLCIFRSNPATHSGDNRPLIPELSGHPFRGNPAG